MGSVREMGGCFCEDIMWIYLSDVGVSVTWCVCDVGASCGVGIFLCDLGVCVVSVLEYEVGVSM